MRLLIIIVSLMFVGCAHHERTVTNPLESDSSISICTAQAYKAHLDGGSPADEFVIYNQCRIWLAQMAGILK